MPELACASCGFTGRLYRIYGNFLRYEQIKCRKCINPVAVHTCNVYEHAYDCPEGYEPVRVDPSDGGVWGASSPADDELSQQSWKAWLTVPTWYLKAVCNFSQVYSYVRVKFNADDIEAASVLISLGWSEEHDLPILEASLRELLHSRLHNYDDEEEPYLVMLLQHLSVMKEGRLRRAALAGKADTCVTYNLKILRQSSSLVDHSTYDILQFLKRNSSIRSVTAFYPNMTLKCDITDVVFEREEFTLKIKVVECFP